ncbi:MAG TPA: SelB C-terminal domain-containing protein [Rectinemataceae bacterium]|nr:SelB C-terminal domain-containing protein [Rectinemataceae bacterium]
MPVIGTAGHVDHGKTALIAALTGMDTDRLPEEKARGMTTDLGFAHFTEGSLRVGVIDVPGHERYIRNMVAGASGIDGALLVVAADDGWMEQTGRHAAVLRALGVPILLLVITKADIVPPERPRLVAKDALSRLAAMQVRGGGYGELPQHDAVPPAGVIPHTPAAPWTGAIPWTAAIPWIAVDSIGGRGIPELRDQLCRILGGPGESSAGGGGSSSPVVPLSSAPSRGPNLIVDRAFELPGLGRVVAGSLRGAELSVGDELLLLPQAESLRVRSLQRYGEAVARAEAGCRVAVSFIKSRATIRRGDCLVGEGSGFETTSSFYMLLDGYSSSFKPRPGLSAELALGSGHREAMVYPVKCPGFLRVTVEAPIAALPGQKFVLLMKGGADVLAAGSVFAFGGHEARERLALEPALRAAASALPSSVEARQVFELERAGCLRLGAEIRPPSGAVRAGDWIFPEPRWRRARALFEAAAAEPGGFPEIGMAGRLGLPREATLAIARRLAEENIITLNNGSILPPRVAQEGDGGNVSALPKALVELAKRLERAGEAGLDLAAESVPGLKRDLAALCRAGLATSLDGRLHVAPRVYAKFVDSIVGPRSPGSTLALGEAKAATGLSRKWIIPLLNRMEHDGYLRRVGDEREILGKLKTVVDS